MSPHDGTPRLLGRSTPPVVLMVMAKAPVPGISKTRLSPPCTPEEAAGLARAALVDTLAAMASTTVARRAVVLDGLPGPWLPEGFEVVSQRGDGLDERLAAAFEAVGWPAVAIAADTPQVDRRRLAAAVAALMSRDADAVLGECPDGGYWAIGLRRPDPEVFLGVPMSSGVTADEQRARLRSLGLRHRELPSLRDVDAFDDAVAVAREIPSSRFASALRPILARLGSAHGADTRERDASPRTPA